MRDAIGRLFDGAVYGLLAAMTVWGVERATSSLSGLPLPPAWASWVTGVMYATGGALLGALLGSRGLAGLQLAFGWTAVATSWVVGGRIAATLEGGLAGGLAAGAVVTFGLLVALAVGQVTPSVPQVLRGLNALGMLGLTAILTLNLHNLPHPLDALSLSVGALVLVVALVFASLAAWSAGDGAPWVSMFALAGISWGTVAAFQAAPEPTWPLATKPARPVVLVAISGLRADHVSGFGYDKPTTPHLDALAGRGLSWREAHATSNWTVPALGSVLTGQMPYTHGAGLNGGRGNGEGPLRIAAIPMAATLRAAGRVTACVSGDPWDRVWGFDAGCDAWRSDPEAGPMPLVAYPWIAVTGNPLLWPLRRPAEQVTDEALAFVSTQRRGGWFLFVHYVDAAGPFLYSPDEWNKVGARRRSWNGDDYDAAVRAVDDQLGRLLRALPPETVVAVVGTRGVEIDEGRENEGLPYGVRVGHNLHQEQIHVPLVLAGASVGTADRPVSTVDVAPTVLAMVNVPPPPGYEGLALREVAGVGDDRPVVAQSVRWGSEQQAVRIGQFKLIRDWNRNERIFDLRSDPSEVRALDAGLDLVERELAKHLGAPDSGAAWLHAESPGARLGAFLVDRWRRTPWGAAAQ